MIAPFALDDPQRKALELISTVAQGALVNNGYSKALGTLPRSSASGSCTLENLPPAVLRAKALYAARRRRDRAFTKHANLLADPAWDILLDLFIAYYENRKVAVTSACVAACVPPTTGLRWLATLERRNLIERVADEQDRRRQFVRLSAEALALVEHALA